MSELALLGGNPVVTSSLQPYNSIGQEEIKAVQKVMESGCLSGFYGSPGNEFYGGPIVQKFEKLWAKHFQVSHAISMNSATSGLFAAIGAIGIKPGDEVIVPPYTMSATAMAPLIYGGIPVFVDIEPDTFCLDPIGVEKAITPKTKAILVVNLFGHPAKLEKLLEIAKKHKIWLIEDNAQAPLAMENGKYSGTVGDIGVFSLNYHKHIHTGEGGICVSNNETLAKRLSMIRNHGENVVADFEIKDITNLVGFNYRLTELGAAIGVEQLRKIDTHVANRVYIAEKLSQGIQGLEGITTPIVRENCSHVYYVWALRIDENVLGISTEKFAQAIIAEGFPVFTRYVAPLYTLPLFQQKIAFAEYPFHLTSRVYKKGLCPTTEKIHEREFLGFEPCAYQLKEEQINLLIEAFRKVHKNRHKLETKKCLKS